MDINVHDLIKINGAQALETSEPLPPWAAFSLKKAPYVVVRRVDIANNKVPVGIRGKNRTERMAAWIAGDNIVKVITPEEIVHQQLWTKLKNNRKQLAQIKILYVLDDLLTRAGVTWGPGGSTGFEMVSETETIGAQSDVDIIIRANDKNMQKIAELIKEIPELSVRIDVLIETRFGAVALDDYLRPNSKVLLRTNAGPKLHSKEEIFYRSQL